MKHTKRLVCLLLVLVMCLAMLPVSVGAATTLTITNPVDWDKVDRSNTTLKWTAVTGASEYRITIRNNTTGNLLTTQNMSVGKVTSYNISPYLEKIPKSDLPDGVKIFVGAYNSAGTLITSDIVGEPSGNYQGISVCATPEVSLGAVSDISSYGAKFELSLTKDYGSAIEDCGFYVGTSSSKGNMTKYSFKNYGSYSATTKGTKYLSLTDLEPSTTYYVRAYAKNGIGENYTSYKSFTTAKQTGSLSLDKTSVSMTYNSGRATVTVTSSGSWTVSDPEYNVSASAAKGYDYDWLIVSTSGNKLYLTPRRPNCAASARSAEVTVSCGSLKKTVTVTQAKCGEAAPTITISRAGAVLSNEDHINDFKAQNGNMEVDVKSTNVRRIVARLFNENGSKKYDEQILTLNGAANESSKIALDMSDCTEPGKYKILVYASNSATANDYYSQSAFSGGSMTLYFTIIGPDPSPNGDRPATLEEAKAIVDLSNSQKVATVKKGRIRRVSQVTGDTYYYSGHWDYPGLTASGKCTRCAYSEALSYLGIDCTPADMSSLYGSAEIYDPGASDVYTKITKKLNERGYSIKERSAGGTLSAINSLYANYESNSNCSPVYIWFKYTKKSGASSSHAVLLIGKAKNSNNVFYAVDSSCYGTKNVFELTISGDKIASTDYPTDAAAYYYKGGQITYSYQWYLDGDSNVCTHSWGSWSNSSSTQHKRTCSKCGEAQTGNHSWGAWSNYNTTNHKHTCSVCSTVAYAAHTWNAGVVTKEPTTTTTGIRTYTCTTCSATKTETIPVVECNHSWGAWGTMGTNQHERTCSKCGETQTESHTWGAWSSTGTSQHKHTCTKCQTTNYADHTWNGGVVTKEPTTTSTGIRTYTCTTCGETDTETIPALDEDEHRCTYSTQWSSDDTYHWLALTCGCEGRVNPGLHEDSDGDEICDVCDYNMGSVCVSHTWDSGMVIKEPTTSSNGIKLYTCTNCGETRTETIPQLEETDPEPPVYPDADAVIEAVTTTAKAGDIVDVAIRLKDNPGIAYLNFKVEYDASAMTLQEVVYNGEFDANDFILGNTSNNPFNIVMTSFAADNANNGILLTLRFRINSDCEDGTYPICLTDVTGANINEEEVLFDAENGAVTVTSVIPGDVTGDGKFNGMDLIRLGKYFAGWDVVINKQGADVTGDGKVNGMDLIRLGKYFAGWDVQLGK